MKVMNMHIIINIIINCMHKSDNLLKNDINNKILW